MIAAPRAAVPPRVAPPHGVGSLTPLLERPRPGGALRAGTLPAELRDVYGGDLAIPLRPDRPTLVANFVSTLDGVVGFDREGRSGGREVSGFHEPDRFVMGLLRAAADVVLVGAGTARAGSGHLWRPADAFPAAADAFAALRRASGLPPNPATVIVTRNGALDPRHPALVDPAAPVAIATTGAGARRLARGGLAPHVRLAVGDDEDLVPTAIRLAMTELGARVVLSEGGPHLLGGLFAAGAVDELFLTVAPQVAGRDARAARLALVEDVAFSPGTAPWARLVSARASGEHLFLRYRFDRPVDAGTT